MWTSIVSITSCVTAVVLLAIRIFHLSIGEGVPRPAEAENSYLLAKEKYKANPNAKKSMMNIAVSYAMMRCGSIKIRPANLPTSK